MIKELVSTKAHVNRISPEGIGSSRSEITWMRYRKSYSRHLFGLGGRVETNWVHHGYIQKRFSFRVVVAMLPIPLPPPLNVASDLLLDLRISELCQVCCCQEFQFMFRFGALMYYTVGHLVICDRAMSRGRRYRGACGELPTCRSVSKQGG